MHAITVVLLLLEAFKVIHIGWFLCFVPSLIPLVLFLGVMLLSFVAAFLGGR